MATQTSDLISATVPGEQWAADFFRTVDTKDIDKLAAWLADDVELRFGNGPTTVGKGIARDSLGRFFETIAGLRHVSEGRVLQGDVIVQFSQVTYTRRDGSQVTVPAATKFRRADDGRVAQLWVFIDLAPLFAPSA